MYILNFLSFFTDAKGEYFMTKKTARDFSRVQIKHIAEQYASTALDYSAEYFAREYKISENTFYTLLKKAVVESIVDLNTVDYMERKASGNSAGHAGAAGSIRSLNHYRHLKQKRKIYLPSNKECAKISTEFANSKLSMSQYSKKMCIASDSDLLKRIVCHSTDKSLLSTQVVKLLQEKNVFVNPKREQKRD